MDLVGSAMDLQKLSWVFFLTRQSEKVLSRELDKYRKDLILHQLLQVTFFGQETELKPCKSWYLTGNEMIASVRER